VRVASAAVLVLGLVASAVLLSAPVTAEPPFVSTCGVIRAFAAPSGSAAGSITIADQTFALTSHDLITAAAVGRIACLDRTVTTSGPAFALVDLPAPLCGEVIGVGAASLDLFVQPTLRLMLGFAAGFSFQDPGRAVTACFDTGLDAAGRVVAVRSITVTPSPRPAPRRYLRPRRGMVRASPGGQ
jgi:hypothetical protein